MNSVSYSIKNVDMKKEPLFVAISNQKGGVGKSAITIMLAGYFHYLKGLNVAVVDCDFPQFSLIRMKERDMRTVENSEYFRQLLVNQWNRIHKKAYAIVGAQAENAREATDQLRKDGEYDLILVDLPGTVNSAGVIRTIINMDYVITPIIADRIVMHSSLSFSTTVLEYVREHPDIPLKDILFFWNKKDARASTEVFDAYNSIMKDLGLTLLDAVIPDTNRYDKELSTQSKNYFRCTLFPPPAKLMKGSGLSELAEELIVKLKLDGYGEK